MRQFITEPLKAHNPKQFVVGLGHGSLALAKYGAFGVLLAFEQLLGGTAKGLAMLTMDQEYINRFRVRPSSYRQRMLLGVQAAGVGIYEGITGVIREPITGWQDDGAAGALLGVLMGTSGLLLKPTSGLLAFVARTMGGLGAGIRAWGDDMVRAPRTRIRSPRQFAALAGDPSNAGEALNFTRWRATIARLQQGRYAGEPVLDFLQNKDRKALVITTSHIIYLNTHQQRIRWAFSIGNLSSVTASGLVVLLHHQLSMRAGGTRMLRIPVRKRVECRTRDLHQSLIVKLSRAISRSSGDQADAAGQHHPDLFTDSLGQDNLHVMHQERMHPMARAGGSPPPSPTRRLASSCQEQPAVRQSVREDAQPEVGKQPSPSSGGRDPPGQAAAFGIQPRESVRFAGNLASHAPADDAASAPAEQSSIEGVLGVARHLTREVGAHGTSAQTASQLLRTLALTCHEWSSGATEAQSDLACALASLETVARSNAVLDVLQLPQSRVHVCTSLQLLLATAERLAEKPAQA